GVVAADDGGDDRGPGPGPRAPGPDPFEQLFHAPQRRLRPRIAAVEPGGDRYGELVTLAERHGGEEMLVQGVHAAGADEPEQVQRAAPLLDPGAQLHERGQVEEVTGLNGLRDAY